MEEEREMIKTGFKNIDELIGGLEGGSLYFIAGRPSMGKTTLVINIAEFIVSQYSTKVLMFSLQSHKQHVVNKILSSMNIVDIGKITEGAFSKETLEDKDIQEDFILPNKVISQLYLEDNIYYIEDMEDKINNTNDLGLIIIDYFQLIESRKGTISDRRDTLDYILRVLKRIAKNKNVPVVIVSTLSRNCEDRSDKRPIITDLRDTGAIEDIADVVLFIYRDEHYYSDSLKRNIAEIIIAKNKFSETGIVDLAFLPQYSKFGNLLKDEN